MDISSRKKKILAAVIEEYIRTAEPVGSKAIAASADLGCSSATIRNELAELVAMGYLEQPHTSAGRVPTPLGYRMYVNELMEHKDLTAEETQAITQSLTGRHQRGELMTDASRLASQLTNYPAVTLTTSAGVTIRRFDLIYLDANSFIIVLLLSDDTVKNKLVHLPVSAEQSMIQKLATVFNAHFTGIHESDITPVLIRSAERAAQDNLGITAVIAAFAIEVLTGAGTAQTYLVGESQLLHQPEFRDPDKAHRLMSYLSDGSNLLDIPMEQLGGDNEVRVLIGPENVAEELPYDLARLLVDMIQTDKYGRYHATNEGLCSWYEFAKEIFRQAGMDVPVTPVSSDAFPAKATRPSNSRLNKDKLSENGFERLPAWQDALGRFLKEIEY